MPDVKVGENCGLLRKAFGQCAAKPTADDLGSGGLNKAAVAVNSVGARVEAAEAAAMGGDQAPQAPPPKPMEIKF